MFDFVSLRQRSRVCEGRWRWRHLVRWASGERPTCGLPAAMIAPQPQPLWRSNHRVIVSQQ